MRVVGKGVGVKFCGGGVLGVVGLGKSLVFVGGVILGVFVGVRV